MSDSSVPAPSVGPTDKPTTKKRDLTHWRSVNVYVEPWAGDPFIGGQHDKAKWDHFDTIAEALYAKYVDDTPGFGSDSGVLNFSFFDEEPLDSRLAQIAELLYSCGLRAHTIWGRVEWCVM